MWRVLIRSRNGNLILAVVGAIYALSAVAVLAWFVADVWQAAAFADLLLQVALVGATVTGIWFVSNALRNLGERRHRGTS